MFNAAMNDIAQTFNTPTPVAYGGTGAATLIGGWDAINSRGTAVATGSSINLTTATGANLHLTGTATVNTVTLAAGAIRFVVADAAAQLTASAGLVVNGSTVTPYTTTAGDLLIFWGDPSSVVRVWSLGSASGFVTLTGTQTLTNKTLTQPVVTLKQSASPAPTAEGDIQWDTDDDRLVIGDGSGAKVFSPNPASTTIGDLPYFSAANVVARRAIGSTNDVLTVSGGLPVWAPPASSGMPVPGNNSFPVGVALHCAQGTGSGINNNATTAGSNLGPMVITSSGGVSAGAATLAGTWRNISGSTVPNTGAGYFVRIS